MKERVSSIQVKLECVVGKWTWLRGQVMAYSVALSQVACLVHHAEGSVVGMPGRAACSAGLAK